MKPTDKAAFALLIAGVYAYHSRPCSKALIEMYWRGCQRWDIEQITKAIDELTNDAEAGKFAPKIGDITRVLEGTKTDRAALAWGKALEAMSAVGAYQDVVFDDPAIHAAVDDLGGWPKLCRTEFDDLSYAQHRFCESYRAYVGRGTFEFPRRLSGARDSDDAYLKVGMQPPQPVLVGDREACRRVFEGGSATGKTQISFAPIALINSTLTAQGG